MRKSRFFSSKVEVPLNANVVVRAKPDAMLNESQLTKLNAAYNDAIKRINIAHYQIGELIIQIKISKNQSIDQRIQKKFQFLLEMLKLHFGIDYKPQETISLKRLNTISQTLFNMCKGLCADKRKLFISDISSVSRKEDADGFYTYGYIYYDCLDRIYIDFDLLKKKKVCTAQVLIHEASHLFGGICDNAYYRKKTSASPLFPISAKKVKLSNFILEEHLSIQKRINNADSFERFVVDLTNNMHLLTMNWTTYKPIPEQKRISVAKSSFFYPTNNVKDSTSLKTYLIAAGITLGGAILSQALR